MKTYITYGFKIDDPKEIKMDLRTGAAMKPASALWGSPIDAEFGWKEWCECEQWIPGDGKMSFEEYFDIHFTWSLKEDSKIFTISTNDDLLELKSLGIIRKDTDWRGNIVDFNVAYNKGYSAIELTDPCIGHRFYDELELLFNGWDCESIVVLDPGKIILLETQ